jgi:L-aspartate oxidase
MSHHIVIVGSGIAGLTLATKLSETKPDLPIILITKAAINECNTRYAQGGIAAVMNRVSDSFEEHIHDTLVSGKGLCDREVVEMVVRQAPECIQELATWGVRFNKTRENNYDLALEGGHQHPRVIHHDDSTGFEIESVLISQIEQRKNIQVLEYHSAIDLITQSHQGITRCVGIKVLDWKQKKIKSISATTVIIASGGCGQVYLNTTNPLVATGDGYVLAGRAGAVIRDMRYMQFHPTSLFTESKNTVSFLISEAIRGFGAYLVDKNGKRFLFSYDVLGELATRDIVSSAIMDHLSKTGEKCVYLDLRHLNPSELETHFPSIFTQLKLSGFDPCHQLIPVVPSAHYQCGGIKVNTLGETSIKNLYAIGEVASTGLHGANRLASNSLLEALVFANHAAENILNGIDQCRAQTDWKITETVWNPLGSEIDLDQELHDIKCKMSASAFSNLKESIQKKRDAIFKKELTAEALIQENKYSEDLLNLRNMACTARYILEDKLKALQNNTNIHKHNLTT